MAEKKMTVRQARNVLAFGTENEKEAVKQELNAIAASNVTDVLRWNDTGFVTLKSSDEIPVHVQKSIKKVKITPNQYGNAVEVEMHDKLAALRVLAKYHGLNEPNSDSDSRPSILGINMKGPVGTTYEVVEDDDRKDGADDTQPPAEKDDSQRELF